MYRQLLTDLRGCMCQCVGVYVIQYIYICNIFCVDFARQLWVVL